MPPRKHPTPTPQSPLLVPPAPARDLAPVGDTLRLMSWNVNGIRAAYKKGFADFLSQYQPEVLGLQETKARPEQLTDEQRAPLGYETIWNSAEKPGYSGVALLTRVTPGAVLTTFPSPALNGEGRIVSAEFGDLTLLNVYFPNGKRDAGRLRYKLDFYAAFLDLVEDLRARGRGVVFCGDVNTAHREIDLARPKENARVSGFLPEERAWIDALVARGYVDTLRRFQPDTPELYTWWDQLTRARDRNVGWRIDYFFVSPELADRVVAAGVHPEVDGSDHCPVSLTLRMR